MRRAFDLLLIMESTYQLAMELLLAWSFSCSDRVCDSQCECECRLRALHVYRLHRQTDSSTTVSASGSLAGKNCCDEKHDVLDANGTSEDVAERRGCKMWPEGVAERRGPKACLPRSRT